jgi:hypothetical protein
MITSAMAAAWVVGSGGQDEPGGGFGGVGEQVGQDTGVGVGGEQDAAMPELGLDGFEVNAGAMSEASGAVPQVVQSDWWESGLDQ